MPARTYLSGGMAECRFTETEATMNTQMTAIGLTMPLMSLVMFLTATAWMVIH